MAEHEKLNDISTNYLHKYLNDFIVHVYTMTDVRSKSKISKNLWVQMNPLNPL